MKISDVLKKENIIMNFEATSKDEALDKLARHILRDERNKNLICRLLNEREQSMSTGVSPGFAIPHCHTEMIDDFRVAIAISKKGINFDSIDGSPTYVFVVIISPKDKVSKYLSLLSHTSRIFKNDTLIEELKAAKDETEVFNIIKRYEEE